MTEDPRNPEVLVSVSTEIEAASIVAALANFGIEAVTTGEFTAGFRAEAPGGVQVLVKQKDFSRARQALEEIRQNQSPIDWSNVDLDQPEDLNP